MTSNSDELQAALRHALNEVTFDTGRVQLQFPGGSRTHYAGRPDDMLDPESIVKLQRDPKSGGKPLRQLKSASVVMSDKARSTLTIILRKILSDYIDSSTDSIGHAFPMGGRWTEETIHAEGHSSLAEVSSIRTFADALLRGAVVLGPERIASLVADWARGEPMVYRACNVVPITLARPLSPQPGVDIVPLPLSTAQLPGEIPSLNTVPLSSYLGHTLISVRAVAKPSLFHGTEESLSDSVTASLPSRITFDLIRDALALECNAHIDRGLSYSGHGDLTALAKGEATSGTLGHMSAYGTRRSINFETGESTLHVPDDAIHDVSNTRVARLIDNLRDAKPPTRVAVSRWVSAMNTGRRTTDRFIDLRIALESLFLPQQPDQELKFRLTVSGAWMIGRDGPDRLQVYETLRHAYDLASKAVHRGHVKQNPANTTLLHTALDVCRRGILRALQHGPVNDWKALILDLP